MKWSLLIQVSGVPGSLSDPLASWQKPHGEESHPIRRILPKGTFFLSTDADVHLITEQSFNPVPRESFDNRTPFDLMVSRNRKTARISEAVSDPTR